MSTVNLIITALMSVLENPAALSILFGLIISLAGTQYLKFRITVPNSLQDEHRWFVRAVSLPLGFFPCYFTWPLANRVWVSLCVGLGAPLLYKLIVAIIYWKWPALEARLSSRPCASDE